MIHGRHFVAAPKFRTENYDFDPSTEGFSNGAPLIAQIATDDPLIASRATSILAASGVDGIDLNLGCPQGIARKGNYGAFLLPQIDLVEQILTAMVQSAGGIPVTAKMRIQTTLPHTLELAKRIEATGVSLLVVHGRTKRENKTLTGAADVEAIRAVVEALQIPVVANGGIEYSRDVPRLLTETGAAGVMSSEGLLENPTLFDPSSPDDRDLDPRALFDRQITLTYEYLALARLHPPLAFGGAGGAGTIKAHVFKMLYRVLDRPDFHALRNRLGNPKVTR